MLLAAMLLMVFENAAIGLATSFVFAWVVIFIGGIGIVAWNVHTVSFRQRIIPDALLGRVNSVYRFFGWGMMPLGTLLGGFAYNLPNYFGGENGPCAVHFYSLRLYAACWGFMRWRA